MVILTLDQAYKAMYLFLDDRYSQTHSDDLGDILSGMSLLEDGSPADAAYEEDWAEAVQKALQDKVKTSPLLPQATLTSSQAFQAMYNLLEHVSSPGGFDDVRELLKNDLQIERGVILNPATQQEWNQAVDRALHDNESIQMQLLPQQN